MKRGPTDLDTPLNKRRKVEEAQINELPAEIFSIIYNFIPTFRSLGKNSIRTVCSIWNKNIEKEQIFSKISFEKIINNCLSSPNSVNAILNDVSILNHLSLDQFYELISCNPEIITQILTTPELYNAVCENQSIYYSKSHPFNIFAQHYINIAELIIKTPKLAEKLDRHCLTALCINHPSVFQLIIDTPAVVNKLGGDKLAVLGSLHPDIAKQIIETPALCNKLNAEELQSLCIHSNIATTIINTPELLDFLLSINHVNGHALGMNEDTAHLLLNMPKFCEKLNGLGIALFGSHHESVAKRIIETPDLLKKLCQVNSYDHTYIASMGAQDSIAELILQTPKLCEMLLNTTGHYRIIYPLIIAEYIVENKKNLTGRGLHHIGRQHSCIARKILTNPELYNKLDGDDLATLGQQQLALANIIMETPDFIAKLKSPHLTMLGCKYSSIAEQIMKTPELVNVLDPFDLHSLGLSHYFVAECIINSPELCNKLSGHDLAMLGSSHFRIAKRILNTPFLLDKIVSDNQLRFLSERQYGIAKDICSNPELFEKLDYYSKGPLVAFVDKVGSILDAVQKDKTAKNRLSV